MQKGTTKKNEYKPIIEIGMTDVWHVCPKCEGYGSLSMARIIHGTMDFSCPVCEGEKVIHASNGVPPSKQ